MIALTRPVSETIGECQLTHLGRVPIDADRAACQHEAYEEALRAAECTIERVPPAPDLPDAVFVEDTVVVTPEVAVITRPGAEARLPELDAVAAVMAGHRPLRYLEPPATLDGGDVLIAGRTVLVGASTRTNREGAAQLRDILEPLGYEVRRVPLNGCLHLKTAATLLDPETLLVNPEWVACYLLADWRRLEVDPREPRAANVLRVGDRILMAAGHPRTRARLTGAGFDPLEVDLSELAKAEGSVTCCSVLVAPSPAARKGAAA